MLCSGSSDRVITGLSRKEELVGTWEAKLYLALVGFQWLFEQHDKETLLYSFSDAFTNLIFFFLR